MVFIEVEVRVDGYHCWPDAPERLAFLRARHRHTMLVRAQQRVTHNERDIEFFELADQVRHALEATYPAAEYGALDFGAASCETIAAALVRDLDLSACGVFEDGKHGAWVHQEAV